MDPYIIRVHAPSGRYRLEVTPETSLKSLYAKVAEKCKYSSGSQFYLYTDTEGTQKLRHSSSTTVGGSGSKITADGQILYLKPSSKRTVTPSSDSVQDETLVSKQQTPPPAFAPAVSSTTNEKRPNALELSGSTAPPKFMSFDQFLKDRSYNTADLPLAISYKPKPLVKGLPNTIPPSVTLKHQVYRAVDHIEFRNVEEMNNLVHYWRYDRDMLEQRAGWLFGYFVNDPHYPQGVRAVVEAIYEPPQTMKACGSVELLPDPRRPTVNALAAALGLQCVGFLFTHLPREELLTAEEILRSARFQLDAVREAPSHYTGYPVSPFVTVTISLDTNDAGVATNAFMVSDLGMAFVRDDLITSAPDGVKLKTKDQPSSLLVPQLLEGGQSVKLIDPHWFVVRINDSAPKIITSVFNSWSFPIENRLRPTQMSDIAAHLTQSHTSQDPLFPFADFHFILYIAELFDEATAKVVCDCVVSKTPLDPLLVDTLKLLQRA